MTPEIIIANYRGHTYVFGPFEDDVLKHEFISRLEDAWLPFSYTIYPLNDPTGPLGLAETSND